MYLTILADGDEIQFWRNAKDQYGFFLYSPKGWGHIFLMDHDFLSSYDLISQALLSLNISSCVLSLTIFLIELQQAFWKCMYEKNVMTAISKLLPSWKIHVLQKVRWCQKKKQSHSAVFYSVMKYRRVCSLQQPISMKFVRMVFSIRSVWHRVLITSEIKKEWKTRACIYIKFITCTTPP